MLHLGWGPRIIQGHSGSHAWSPELLSKTVFSRKESSARGKALSWFCNQGELSLGAHFSIHSAIAPGFSVIVFFFFFCPSHKSRLKSTVNKMSLGSQQWGSYIIPAGQLQEIKEHTQNVEQEGDFVFPSAEEKEAAWISGPHSPCVCGVEYKRNKGLWAGPVCETCSV